MNRHKARENAFLLVFESLFLDLGFEKLLCIAAEMEEIKLNEYSKKIIAGVLQHRTEIDEKIKLLRKEETENLNAQEYKDFNIKDFL